MSYRPDGSNVIPLKGGRTSWTTTRGPPPGSILDDNSIFECMARTPMGTIPPSKHSLFHSWVLYRADGKCALPTPPECTSWITIRRRQLGTTPGCHLPWTKTFRNTNVTSVASSSILGLNQRCVSCQANAMSRCEEITSSRILMRRSCGKMPMISRNVL